MHFTIRMKLYWRFFIVFGLLGTLSEQLLAAHIIGGEMYYECQGYGSNGLDSTRRTYKIIIKLYRDCRPQQNSAGFDQPLGFTIYRKMPMEAAIPMRWATTGNTVFQDSP
ncbi:MAG: hypothetical protein IPN15_07340 [Saprospiraceae bacterium]|nr:hypothetical protein [Candidatus Vicinibacter affinis]